MLEKLKEELVDLHLELPKNNLVVWTGGNVSARDPETGLIVIKASGIRYEEMRPQHMVVVDPDGKVVEGGYKPSSDVTVICISINIVPMSAAWCLRNHDMKCLMCQGLEAALVGPSKTSVGDSAPPEVVLMLLRKWLQV